MDGSFLTARSPSVAGSERDPLEQLAAQFLDLHRQGQRPVLADFAAQHPQYSRQILELFPALVALEAAGPRGVHDSLGFCGEAGGATQQTIGDYRLLREIGRGAMGVVYEAEQCSLDRHVALKVLPWHATASNVAVERFRREAKAAARLHHTNIVPVFEVGQAGEVCFYAMQFIEGRSLDKIVVELRRLQRRDDASLAEVADQEVEPSARSLALSLSSPVAGPAILLQDTVRVQRDETANAAPQDPQTLSLAQSSKQHYFRSIARIGQQVAEALAYAHERGVIHRDIKPSNILLDATGVAWVADFGLAKTDDVALTRSGDILGTIRYMAPERFEGECEPAADVYSLGVTLYELLVLRPPHETAERAELIAHITQRDVPRLRTLDPRISRDLEMIVHKAIEREPSHRYANATALAEDLRRFLADEPILGRRVSVWRRLWRWMRHNRLLATTTLGSAVLLLTVAIAASFASAQFLVLATQERTARLDTAAHLYRSLVGEAKATRLARREGYREQVWALLDEARRVESEAVDRRELRREAIQSLGDFVGLQPRVLSKFPAPVRAVAVASHAPIVAVGLENGAIQWHDAATGKRLFASNSPASAITQLQFTRSGALLSADAAGMVRLWSRRPDKAWQATRVGEVSTEILALQEGSLERLMVASRLHPDDTVIHIDNLAQRRRAQVDPGLRLNAATFSSDGSLLAGVGENSVYVWETGSGRLIERTTTSLGELTGATFSSDGSLLLCTGEQGLVTFDLPELQQQNITRTGQVAAAALNAAGSQLAMFTQGRRVSLWSVHGNRELATLSHPGRQDVHTLAFDAHDQRLVSADRDTVRIWNLQGSPEVMELPGHAGPISVIAFSPDSARLLSGSKDHSLTLWNVNAGQRLGTTNLAGPLQAGAFSANGRLLAAADTSNQLTLLDGTSLKAHSTLEHTLGLVQGVAFTRDRRHLIACGEQGVRVWSLGKHEEDPSATPQLLRTIPATNARSIAVSADSRLVAWHEDTALRVLVLDAPTTWTCTAPPALAGRQNLVFHPDGRHVFFVDAQGQLVQWDLFADRLAAVIGDLETFQGGELALHPAGRWLAVNANPWHVDVWDTVEHRQEFVLREQQTAVSGMAWSTSGDRLAYGSQMGRVTLWKLGAIRKALAAIELDWSNDQLLGAAVAKHRSTLVALDDALRADPEHAMLRVRRASVLLAQGKTDAALADLDRALKAKPPLPAALAARASLHVHEKKWAEAAEDLRQSLSAQPDSLAMWLHVALLLARAERADAYHDHCQAMLDRFAAEGESESAERLLRFCSLLPGKFDETMPLRRQVEGALNSVVPDRVSPAQRYITLALADLRAGDAESALRMVARAHEDSRYSITPVWQAMAMAIQAIAELQVHKPHIARESLRAAQAFAAGVPSAKDGDDLATQENRLQLEILLQETARLLP